MTAPHSTEPMGNLRSFTAIPWLLWTAIPVGAVYAAVWMGNFVDEEAKNAEPGGAMGIAAVAILLALALVPAVATLQWLILRRIWPNVPWLWPAWLAIVIVACIAFMVSVFNAVPILNVLTIGLAPAVILTLAAPKPLRRFTFAVILISFTSGFALAWGIEVNRQPIGLFLLNSSYPFNSITAHPTTFASAQFKIYAFIFKNLEQLLLTSAAAISGFGLWHVSRWASRNEAALSVADRVSAP